MTRFTLHQAAAAAGGNIVRGSAAGRGADGQLIQRWVFDSRLPFPVEGTCFLALGAGARKGASYVASLIERGVEMFCVSARDFEAFLPAVTDVATYWIVADVLSATQHLAQVARENYAGPVLGITGSNGKTIVKEWTYALLRELGQPVYRSPGSYNSQLGVALSVLHADRQAAILEVGVSQRGDMARLTPLAQPTIGLLTNLGAAHDAGFADRREKLREKLSLFASASALVYCADDAWLDGEVRAWLREFAPKLQPTPWRQLHPSGEPTYGDLDGIRVRFDRGEVLFSGLPPSVLAKAELTLPCPFLDVASRQNLCHAVLGALLLNAALGSASVREPVGPLAAAISLLPHEEMRLQAYAGRDGIRVIDDSYSADVEGFAAAAEFFTQQALLDGPRVWIVGLPARGLGSDVEPYREITGLAERAGVARLVTVGGDAPAEAAASNVHFAETSACLAQLDRLSLERATVLVKGPRAARMDVIARRLREQSHELRLEINLAALAHNIAAYRARLSPSTRLCVMVKAQAYGSGGAEVAAFFEQRGVDYLAVATVDEGLQIRRRGVRVPIIVAHVLAEEVALVREYGLEPEVSSLTQLLLYRGSSAGAEADVPLHLKVDTGMRRLGFDVTLAGGDGLQELVGALKADFYQIKSVFSHLSASDRSDADGFTGKQNLALVRAADAIASAVGYRPMVHLLNSAGAWRLPDLQHDMVRLGLGIYGLGLEHAAPNALEPAHRWVARLVQVRDVQAGDVVGYNLGGAAVVDRRVGIVNVGYADGLRRSAGHGAYALTIDGRRCPTVGSVCMDFTMIDLAQCPQAGPGDEVEIFGRHQSVAALAAVYDTIAYEVFTGIGPRVRRVFYR